MTTHRVQMDENGNFIEHTLESVMAARAEDQSNYISWRDVTHEKQQVTILAPTDAEQSVRRMSAQATHYFERNIAPLLQPQKHGESDTAYASRMASLQHHQGIYDLMIENGLAQAELSRRTGGAGPQRKGVTAEGLAQMEREAEAQEAQEVARTSREFD